MDVGFLGILEGEGIFCLFGIRVCKYVCRKGRECVGFEFFEYVFWVCVWLVSICIFYYIFGCVSNY